MFARRYIKYLFNNIQEYAKTTHNKSINFNIYDQTRREKYGDTHLSYDGYGQCGNICDFVKQRLQQEHNISTEFHRHDIHDFEKLKLHASDHMYLQINDIIIDPTYKQFLVYKRGDVRKMNSYYANLIYSLNPILIIHRSQLSFMYHALKIHKNLDKYHKDDELYEKVYDIDGTNPKSYTNEPYLRYIQNSLVKDFDIYENYEECR
jgi:hypothetical protein